uniref:Beta-hexosaminidase n=1 Tax=Graphocephala atropunctata TaxID=36148 RepID=A0A1B6KR81_9HEMI
MCWFLLLSLCLCLLLAPSPAYSWVPGRTVGQVWPLPQNVSFYTTQVSIDPSNFLIRISNVTCPVLEEAVKRYTDVIKKALPHHQHGQECPGGELKEVLVALTGPCEEWPHLEMDEHYELHVNRPDYEGVAIVSSSSMWGLLRGLETFSQLVTPTTDSCCLVLNSTDILDYPRFKHRGLLLDTARHYLPVPVIYNILAGMEMNKMNVFHWHIVDDESFPYQSITYPSLSEKGAYDPKKLIYTQENVKDIIEFARLRGIRVIPEFDSPGHTRSWGKGASKLLTGCYTNGSFNGQFGPVDPTKNQNFKFIRTLLEEVKGVFKDKYIHVGGDEVQFGFQCWTSNPSVAQFMKNKNITSPEGLESYYMNLVLDMVYDINASAIVWEEVFTHGDLLRNDTVVQIWRTNRQQLLNEVTKAGKYALLSEGWYLDHILDQWQNFYRVDPTDFNGTVAQRQLVLGGEACMWGEMVDETNVVPRIWPRTSAVAERLWSQMGMNETVAAPRLNEHVCRMRHRGVAAQPANGPGFCPY